MKYWKVSLLREGRCARQWHVRAEVLTVGSHGSNQVRLPLPVEPFALRISELEFAQTCEVGPFTLVVEDETHARTVLLSEARIRVNKAISAASAAPREAPVPVRAAIAACTLLGLTNLAISMLVDSKPLVLRQYERNRAAQIANDRPDPVASTPRYEAPQAAVSPTGLASRAGMAMFPMVARSDGPHVTALVRGAPTDARSSSGSSWDGGMILHGDGTLEPSTGPSSWLASTPERYRAPWPDAPVPPH